MRRIILTRIRDGRQWVVFRDTEEDELLFVESIFEQHMDDFAISSTECSARSPGPGPLPSEACSPEDAWKVP